MNSSRVQFTMYLRGGVLWNRTSCQQRHITINSYFFMPANVRAAENIRVFHKQNKGLFTINTHSNLPQSCDMDFCATSCLGMPPAPRTPPDFASLVSRSSYTAEYNPSTGNPRRAIETEVEKRIYLGPCMCCRSKTWQSHDQRHLIILELHCSFNPSERTIFYWGWGRRDTMPGEGTEQEWQ